MLTHIHIRDFAIIDQLEVELADGMTAMTGETGAGKSILVDALGLALGDRADIGVIRAGSERAEISVGFDLDDCPAALAWLQQQELSDDRECLIRRVVNAQGRSRGFINGRPVPMQSLQELGELLVDIHGQHEHQSLLRRDIQRQLLDDYGGNSAEVARLASLYRDWKEQSAQLQRLRDAADDRVARSELLRFQVEELEQLDLAAGEIDSIDEEHRRLANAGELLESCQSALTALYDGDDNTAHDRLGHISTELQHLADLDPTLAPVRDILAEAVIQVHEAADSLRRYTDRLELDPGRLQWIEERLGTIHDLSRKHRLGAHELPGLLQTLRDELDSLVHADEHLGQLETDIKRLRDDYDSCAQTVGKKRRTAAKRLNAEVSTILQELGMIGARFEIAVHDADPPRPSAHGLEHVDFTVSTNPGQPFGALAKIASGGELSRISLAIQVVLADTSRIPTLIYDEVDTGIGGAVAEVVGRRLRHLGDVRQVLCVTHLPQVAAQAHRHLQVSKQAGKDSTRTGIQALDDKARIEEIARMLGGIEISAQSRAHAREMIDRGQHPDQPGQSGQRGRGGRQRKAGA